MKLVKIVRCSECDSIMFGTPCKVCWTPTDRSEENIGQKTDNGEDAPFELKRTNVIKLKIKNFGRLRPLPSDDLEPMDA